RGALPRGGRATDRGTPRRSAARSLPRGRAGEARECLGEVERGVDDQEGEEIRPRGDARAGTLLRRVDDQEGEEGSPRGGARRAGRPRGGVEARCGGAGEGGRSEDGHQGVSELRDRERRRL